GEGRAFAPRVGLARRKRHRFCEWLDRLDVDGDENALLVRWVAVAFADDFDDADDLLLLAGVIEERVLALLHRFEISARDEIAHAGPRLALGAALDLIVPGERLRLGFQKPIRHVEIKARPSYCCNDLHAHDSAADSVCTLPRLRGRDDGADEPQPFERARSPRWRNGRVSNVSVAASALARPARISATALAIGMSMPLSFAISTKTGAVKIPSASACGACAFSPRPSATPYEKLRDCELEQVRITSPSPDRPVSVSARAPKARPKRASSAKPRVTSAAAALAPSPRPATMPAAIASTFLAAPPISTPRTSVEW